MTLPIQTTFRHVVTNPEIERSIRDRADKLLRVYDGILHVKLVIEAPRNRPQSGCQVHLSVSVPGRDLNVRAPHGVDRGPLDAVLCEAFHAARRELMTYTGRKRRPSARRQTIRTLVAKEIIEPFVAA